MRVRIAVIRHTVQIEAQAQKNMSPERSVPAWTGKELLLCGIQRFNAKGARPLLPVGKTILSIRASDLAGHDQKEDQVVFAFWSPPLNSATDSRMLQLVAI